MGSQVRTLQRAPFFGEALIGHINKIKFNGHGEGVATLRRNIPLRNKIGAAGRIALPMKDARRPIKDAGGTPTLPWRCGFFMRPPNHQFLMSNHSSPLRSLATFAAWR